MVNRLNDPFVGAVGTIGGFIFQNLNIIGDFLAVCSAIVGIAAYGFWGYNQYKKSKYYAEKRKYFSKRK